VVTITLPVLYTWLYDSAKKSLLPVILFHWLGIWVLEYLFIGTIIQEGGLIWDYHAHCCRYYHDVWL